MEREEAIRRIKAWNLDPDDREVLATIIPELRESEDERIRKDLIGGLMWQRDNLERLGKHDDSLILPGFCRTVGEHLAYLKKQKEYELTEEDKKIIPEALVMLCDDIINHRVHTPIKTDEEGARKIKAFLKTFNRRPYKTREEWEKQKEPQHAIRVTKGFGDPDGAQFELVDLPEDQKPSEWSEEDKKLIDDVINSLCCYQNTLSDYQKEIVGEEIRKLKSLRPQPKEEIYQAAKHNLAIKFMNYLDENRPEGKMSLSNGECEDIDKAFEENDWNKIMRYANKYAWKPSEEQMKALLNAEGFLRAGLQHDSAKTIAELYEQLQKLK